MSDFLEPSYFEGGEPQSKVNPGDEQRELIHEIRNLNSGLNLLQHLFRQLLPALETLSEIDDKLSRLQNPSSDAAYPAVSETERTSGAPDPG